MKSKSYNKTDFFMCPQKIFICENFLSIKRHKRYLQAMVLNLYLKLSCFQIRIHMQLLALLYHFFEVLFVKPKNKTHQNVKLNARHTKSSIYCDLSLGVSEQRKGKTVCSLIRLAFVHLNIFIENNLRLLVLGMYN